MMHNRDLFDQDMERKANGCLTIAVCIALVAVVVKLLINYWA